MIYIDGKPTQVKVVDASFYGDGERRTASLRFNVRVLCPSTPSEFVTLSAEGCGFIAALNWCLNKVPTEDKMAGCANPFPALDWSLGRVAAPQHLHRYHLNLDKIVLQPVITTTIQPVDEPTNKELAMSEPATRSIGGHRIPSWPDKCLSCGKSVAEILSEDVCCRGQKTPTEQDELDAERKRIFDLTTITAGRSRSFGG